MNSEIDTFIANELTKAEARKAEFIESIRSKYPNVARFEEGKANDLYIWYSDELADVIAELEQQAARESLPTPSHGHGEECVTVDQPVTLPNIVRAALKSGLR